MGGNGGEYEMISAGYEVIGDVCFGSGVLRTDWVAIWHGQQLRMERWC